MRFIPYLRASTKNLQTPEHQLPEIERWAVANGHELLAPVVERESGRNDDRPEWNAVLGRVLRGEADGVVSVDMSRFARSAQHLLQVAAALRKAGRHMACTRQPIDTSTPAGRFTFTIFAALAELVADLGRDAVAKGIAFSRDKRKKAGQSAAWGRRQEQVPPATLRAAGELQAAGLSLRRVSARLYAAGHAQPARDRGRSAHPARPWPVPTLQRALARVQLAVANEAAKSAPAAG